MGRKTQHRFHGAPGRFEAVSEFVYDYHGNSVHHIADVAGGQGMLARMLSKRYNYDVEVVDPRGWTTKGVKSRQEFSRPEMASYYDLLIGLHPDEATRPLAEAALVRPVVLIPCCNYWSDEEKLGRDALVDAIASFYKEQGIKHQRITFKFEGPKNIGLVSYPPPGSRSC